MTTFSSHFMFVFKCIPPIWACRLALPLVEWSGRMRMAKPWPNMCTKELQQTMAQLEAIFHEMQTGFSILSLGPMTHWMMNSAAPSLLIPVVMKETESSMGLKQAAASGSSLLQSPTPMQMVMQMQELQRVSQNEIRIEPRNMHLCNSFARSCSSSVRSSSITSSVRITRI